MKKHNLLRFTYSLLFYLVTPLVLLRLLWRSKKSPAYARRWRERFAFIPKLNKPGGIWLHAVSVGEAIAATPLIKKLAEEYPNKPLIITTTTPTGSERVKQAFEKDVFHVYSPYDLPDVVNRFLKRTKPSLAIMMETELWPNTFAACQHHKIPLIIANARLSPNSVRGYSKIQTIVKAMLSDVSLIAAQSQLDADRFSSLGSKPEQIVITGSMKFDIKLPASFFETASLVRDLWGHNRSVFIAASTHEGEEEHILDAFKLIRNKIKDCLLVLVPRHPERFQKISQLCRKHGYHIILRSEQKACSDETDIFIGDSMGELCAFYAASDVAYVGGSLVKTGGHNPLEPAACRLPIIMGPHIFNFVEISQLLQESNALTIIKNSKELAKTVIHFLKDANYRDQIGNKALQVVENNRGALEKHLALIKQLIGHTKI